MSHGACLACALLVWLLTPTTTEPYHTMATTCAQGGMNLQCKYEEVSFFFWESISMTATNIPAPLLSTWPEHPLIIYCHILRQKFSCLLFSHLSHSHSSALFRFPTQPVFPVILFVWFSTVFLSDAVIVALSPLSSSRNSYISIILHNPK